MVERPPDVRPRILLIVASYLAAVGVIASFHVAGASAVDAVAGTPRPAPAAPGITVGPSLYERAAATCPGLPWSVLAGIHQVEASGRPQASVSSAGAEGPMQFMPRTWAAFGVDGDGDGRRAVTDLDDAVHGAANYLCHTGGADPARLARSLWWYNHSPAYVRAVLQTAGRLEAAVAGGT